jgi:hypothetical protein
LIAVVVGAAAALTVGSGVSNAALDDQQSLVDSAGDTLTVQEWDTFLNGVSPLDRNRLTREWFESGRVAYNVVGPNAANFTGTLELGYQVNFPWALGVGLNFHYVTPNFYRDGAMPFVTDAHTDSSILFPSFSISSDLGNGPGVQEVATFSVPVTGQSGAVRIANAHGTVTGAAGSVVLRPYARLTGKTASDSISTYGVPWNMN